VPRCLARIARDVYRRVWYDMAILQHPGAEPCGLVAAFIKLSLTPLVGDTEAQRAERLGVPARDEFTLAAILLVHCVTQPYVI
jgi:hypothetical protein